MESKCDNTYLRLTGTIEASKAGGAAGYVRRYRIKIPASCTLRRVTSLRRSRREDPPKTSGIGRFREKLLGRVHLDIYSLGVRGVVSSIGRGDTYNSLAMHER